MSVGTLEEIIDDNHAIVSTSVGSEHYVSILSFVDKDLLEPGCSVLLNHKVNSPPPFIKLVFFFFHRARHETKFAEGAHCGCDVPEWQVHAVVGVLSDDTDPLVTVMKLEKAPQESYADVGGLDAQIQEIKV